MTSLASLLDQRLIDEGDELSFVFRTHRFFCTVLPGGHLGFCTWKKSQHANAVPVLRDRGGFKSLTDWCDAALQEVQAIMMLGHQLWAYAYMRRLYNKSLSLYYATILAQPVRRPPLQNVPGLNVRRRK